MENDPAASTPSAGHGSARGPRRTAWVRLVSWAVIVLSAIVLARALPVAAWFDRLSVVVERAGSWGLVIFAAAYVVAALCFVPGAAITMAAGALFGVAAGTLLVSVASTVAAALAFLIARYLARDAVRRWAQRHAHFRAFDRALAEGGWRVVALLRLSPVIPYNALNYLLGLTGVGFLPYVVASWVFMLPGTVVYVAAGSALRVGLAAASAAEEPLPLARLALAVLGLAATLAVALYVTRLMRRAMAEQSGLSLEPELDAPEPAQQESAVGLLALGSVAALMGLLAAIAYWVRG